MKVIRCNLTSLKTNDIREPISLCLGYFDGVHLGHQKLIQRALCSKFTSAVLSFSFQMEVSFKQKRMVTTFEDRIKLLEQMGVEYFIILEFDEIMMRLSPQEFIEKVLIPLNVKELIVGEDYHFGKDALGNTQTLVDLSLNRYEVVVIPEYQINNKKVGTRDIISALKEGNIEFATTALGRYYKITAKVIEGYHYGTLNHVPTANIPLSQYIIPKYGVYAVYIHFEGKRYKGMANVGIHPSVHCLSEPLLEVNIFDFAQDIYQKEIEIEFVHFIRIEQKFPSSTELYDQLKEDEKTCKEYLENIEKEVKKKHKFRPCIGRSLSLCVTSFMMFFLSLVGNSYLHSLRDRVILIIIASFFLILNIIFTFYSIFKLNSFVYMDDEKIQQMQYGKSIVIHYNDITNVKITYCFYTNAPLLFSIYENKKKISFEMTPIFDDFMGLCTNTEIIKKTKKLLKERDLL